jgi:membrane protein DedA with SNARE-associated domain
MVAIPNPVFDFAGIMAGAAGVPFKHFLLGSFVRKSVQMTGIVLAGYIVSRHISLPI